MPRAPSGCPAPASYEPRTAGPTTTTSPTVGTLTIPATAAPSFATLDDQAEHTMTPTTPLIPVCTCGAPVALASLEDLVHTLQARHHFLSQWG